MSDVKVALVKRNRHYRADASPMEHCMGWVQGVLTVREILEADDLELAKERKTEDLIRTGQENFPGAAFCTLQAYPNYGPGTIDYALSFHETIGQTIATVALAGFKPVMPWAVEAGYPAYWTDGPRELAIIDIEDYWRGHEGVYEFPHF